MKILITGAGGFLGKHLARALINEGHSVSNFSRSQYADLTAIGVEGITGDLSDFTSLARAVQGKDAVFHVASKVGIWGRYQDFYQTNVVGTENVIKACLKSGVQKLVYTSTPSVVFGRSDLCGVDESSPYPEKHECFYAATKAIAEKKILSANNSALATVALRPHLIFGPGDHHLFPRILEQAQKGKLKQVGDGKNLVDVVYVENAVAAHLLALKNLTIGSPVSGQAYFIGQESPVNLWQFVDKILTGHGLAGVKKKISAKKAYATGKVLERVYATLKIKRDPPMTGFVALQLSKSHYFSHQKAQRDLGYHPHIGLDEAMKLSLLQNKIIKEDHHVAQYTR
jgi:nucleoside-diphosphate-sugar epimerase